MNLTPAQIDSMIPYHLTGWVGENCMQPNDIDAMTPEQLQDALAIAAGWTKAGAMWRRTTTVGGAQIFSTKNPIPLLDSPEALGVVAGMMPRDWTDSGFSADVSIEHARVVVVARCKNVSVTCEGPTEVIARTRLVQKVLRANHPA